MNSNLASRTQGRERNLYSYGMRQRGYRTLVTLMAIFALATLPGRALASSGQKSFPTAQQAVSALVEAVAKDNDAGLLDILGPAAEDLISSGDQVADRNGKARFLQAYREKNRLEQEEEGRVTLLIGSQDYPFPIPIVRRDNAWLFDTQAGLEEILNRRIGRNELHTIKVMQAYVDAQREYAAMVRDSGVPAFAQKLSSSPGKKDGLYWETREGEPESPFGPLLARASEKGYEAGLSEDDPAPFRGYFFKILKAQGAHADGGAFDYVVDDRMILGFALVAYPAKYGASGIMTFIVNQEGQIYEKDLGETTGEQAASMTRFDPDNSWKKYEEPAAP